jgi:hypothetical protein
MCLRIVLAAVSIALAGPLFGQTAAPYPPGAQAREAQLLARVGPRTRAWVAAEGRREAEMPGPSEAIARAAAQQNARMLGATGSADIEALAFLVLIAATKSAQDDLRRIMDGVNSINGAKSRVRHAAARMNSAQTRLAPRPMAVVPRPVPKAELDARIAAAEGNPDSLNELGEVESLRLQMAMDRMSKLMETLSNVLSKLSNTQSDIVHNMK